MNILQYFRVLRRRWELIVVLAVIGAIAGFALAPRPNQASSLDGPTSYLATHTLFVNFAAESGQVSSPVSLNQAPLLLTGGDVVDRVAQATGEDPSELLDSVVAVADPSLNTVEITYHDADSEKSARIADEFAVQLMATIADIQAQSAAQQIAVLDAQRAQLEAQYNAIEGDPADPLVEARTQALLTQLGEVEQQLQVLGQSATGDPYLLTLRSASPFPVTDAEYDLFVDNAETSAQTGGNNTTARQVQSGIALGRGQAGVNPFLAAIGGSLIGALIGAGLVLILNRIDPRLYNKEDAEEALGFPVIAEIPALTRGQRGSQEIMSREAPYSRFAESVRALRSSIVFVQRTGMLPAGTPAPADHHPESQEPSGVTIMVTSPGPGEGKTTTVANLAAVLAEDGSRVLVVNCDFRRPRLHLYLDAANEPRKVVSTSVPGVKLVSGVVADHQKSSPAAVLSGQRHLVTTARTMFDYILLDTAPILTTTDASEILSVTDMVVVICRSGKTTTESADRAAELLERFQAPVVGGVLVGADESPSSRYYYYYSEDSGPTPTPEDADRDPFEGFRPDAAATDKATVDASSDLDSTEADSSSSTSSSDLEPVSSDDEAATSDDPDDDQAPDDSEASPSVPGTKASDTKPTVDESADVATA